LGGGQFPSGKKGNGLTQRHKAAKEIGDGLSLHP
jgi:hypothetical protein